MTRQCERPGCSAPAAVAYGMDGRQLLVWLEVVPNDGVVDRMGVVCRRHGDAMVVPRGWTLDDRRESRPRLFRVSDNPAPARPRSQRPKRQPPAPGDPEQLSLTMTGDSTVGPDHAFDDRRAGARSVDDLSVDDLSVDDDGAEHLDGEVTVGEIRPLPIDDADETRAMPWRFHFDQTDDLDGMLKAESPLLSRAFRGTRRSS